MVLILEITNLQNEVLWLSSTPHYCGNFFKLTIFFCRLFMFIFDPLCCCYEYLVLLSLSNIGLHAFMTLMALHVLFIAILRVFIAGSNESL